MTKVECVNCGEFHQVDSIEGQVGDEHAKVKYTCSENEILYGAHRLVENMKNVTQEGQDLVA